MKLFLILISICSLIFHYLPNGVEATDCTAEPKNNEARLRKHLFCGYDKDSRPTLTDGPITIKFKMIIKGFKFEDSESKLSVSTWLAMSWNDEHLKWDPKEYNNIGSITHSIETIWQPDLALYNSDIASAQTAICKPSSCLITSKGIVSCIPPCTQAGRCFPKYDRWPYDQQNCTLHIGTWVNSGEEIDFNVLKTIINDDDLSSQDLQWKLIKATYKRNHGNFSATKQTYPSLTFSFLIERHSAEHGAAIIVPALTLVLLNLITLWVDSENNRRITLLSLSTCMHFLCLQQLYWILPSNGDTVPDLLIYFRDSLFITILLIINTIVVQGMLSCTMQTPAWIEKTSTYMGSNRVGQFFLTKHLVATKLTDDDDDIHLVESQSDEKDGRKITSKKWKTFANIVDRVWFGSLCIIYLLMIVDLLPESFFDEKNVDKVEIIAL